jgi:hypothetical protein
MTSTDAAASAGSRLRGRAASPVASSHRRSTSHRRTTVLTMATLIYTTLATSAARSASVVVRSVSPLSISVSADGRSSAAGVGAEQRRSGVGFVVLGRSMAAAVLFVVLVHRVDGAIRCGFDARGLGDRGRARLHPRVARLFLVLCLSSARLDVGSRGLLLRIFLIFPIFAVHRRIAVLSGSRGRLTLDGGLSSAGYRLLRVGGLARHRPHLVWPGRVGARIAVRVVHLVRVVVRVLVHPRIAVHARLRTGSHRILRNLHFAQTIGQVRVRCDGHNDRRQEVPR